MTVAINPITNSVMKPISFFLVLAGSLILTTADHHKESKSLKNASVSSAQRVFELRTYHTHPGKLDDLHNRFRNHTNALFVKHGMTLVGYWEPKDKDNTLVYMLAYPGQEARDASWKAFVNDPEWKDVFKASRADGPLVKNVESTFFTATDYSPIQ